ncbi:uncharacterized protein B0H18DRAFT_1211152 [Fomitopsis serialis]|uniref:uncharacterized protein n=1 Tax=Fomitopsis serialis TaxID=139415 RepID=UPI0020075273|nr:uncharacterized protein B0H18DRAFT_1211152 [Neoantrodia serialis]KAH9926136.1 hypothetical protein B0H18DRAFT_1211152 [Neoantrodia serialis]
MSQLPTCVAQAHQGPSRGAGRTSGQKRRQCMTSKSIQRAIDRIAVAFMASMVFFVFYALSAQVFGTSPPTATHGVHPIPAADLQASSRPSGRWELWQKALVDADVLSDVFESLFDISGLLDLDEDAPHFELRRRELAPDDSPQQQLHFTVDSAQDDALGRDVATNPEGLVGAFRALSQAQREEAQRRVGSKSRQRV